MNETGNANFVAGSVREEWGNLFIYGARLTLGGTPIGSSKPIALSATSRINGNFDFPNVPVGTYSWTCDAGASYVRQEGTVTVKESDIGKTVLLNVWMESSGIEPEYKLPELPPLPPENLALRVVVRPVGKYDPPYISQTLMDIDIAFAWSHKQYDPIWIWSYLYKPRVGWDFTKEGVKGGQNGGRYVLLEHNLTEEERLSGAWHCVLRHYVFLGGTHKVVTAVPYTQVGNPKIIWWLTSVVPIKCTGKPLPGGEYSIPVLDALI